jgi:hypothetical protein
MLNMWYTVKKDVNYVNIINEGIEEGFYTHIHNKSIVFQGNFGRKKK